MPDEAPPRRCPKTERMSQALALILSAFVSLSGPTDGADLRAVPHLVPVAQTRFLKRRLPLCGRKRRSLRRNCVVDGGTLWLGDEEIRVMGPDAPETSSTAKCRKEREIGRKAARRFAEIVSSGLIRLRRRGKDHYGRTLACVFVGGRDAGKILIREGLTVPYRRRATDES